MRTPVFIHGSLAHHRRGRILQEAASAAPISVLPEGQALVLEFGEAFQSAEQAEQERLVEWTRASGHSLLLLPPFGAGRCASPVSWRADRREAPPGGGEGLAQLLASEVGYRLTGQLQTPAVPGASWSDLSVCLGVYRRHPAAGLFAVTTLPLWSLAVLDESPRLQQWLDEVAKLAGESESAVTPEAVPLSGEHYGVLVHLLSSPFDDEEQAIDGLLASPIFRTPAERGRSLLKDLQDRGLVAGATPTDEAEEMVMNSPYAHYVSALREVSRA